MERADKNLAGPTRAAALLAAAVAAASWSCATTDEAGGDITYSMTARQNYDKGLAELKDENYEEAARYFGFVKQKFPFSKYAVLAELALADTKFEQGEYQAAIDAYKSFIRLHPTHEKVEDGTAAFRICECYVKDMPGDFFILPPAYEKDQTPVREALRELTDFLDKYPDSKLRDAALGLRRQVMQRLVDHEVYVARFYLARSQPRAASSRLRAAIQRYPDSGREASLLLTLGETLLEMGDMAAAKDTFARVVADHGDAPEARQAALYLDFIRRQYDDGKQARSSAGVPHG